jgi:hypothetical protein
MREWKPYQQISPPPPHRPVPTLEGGRIDWGNPGFTHHICYINGGAEPGVYAPCHVGSELVGVRVQVQVGVENLSCDVGSEKLIFQAELPDHRHHRDPDPTFENVRIRFRIRIVI